MVQPLDKFQMFYIFNISINCLVSLVVGFPGRAKSVIEFFYEIRNRSSDLGFVPG